jgi:hypothetical protein
LFLGAFNNDFSTIASNLKRKPRGVFFLTITVEHYLKKKNLGCNFPMANDSKTLPINIIYKIVVDESIGDVISGLTLPLSNDSILKYRGTLLNHKR